MLQGEEDPLSPQLLDLDEEVAEDTNERDLDRLKQAWINERAAPEILEYQGELIDVLTAIVDTQEENVRNSESENLHTLFMAQLYLTEIGRIRYLIKSYLRTRMFKIEKHALSILKDPDMKARLSRLELVFAGKYAESFKQHMGHSFLHFLDGDAKYKGEPVPAYPPKLNQYVFCKILEDLGPTHLDEMLEGQDFHKDSIFVLPYELIKDMVFDEDPKIALM